MPKEASGGFDQDLSSQQHEGAGHTPAEGLPFPSLDNSAPVSSEHAPDPTCSMALSALPQKAFGTPSERQSVAHASQV